ncbi:MAG TPA: flagellar basal body rod protein FlgC [Bryobacteraceae bacterium]|nr:flagellar basal body rod protein FlgC [Bryobacteraceae bacterium]
MSLFSAMAVSASGMTAERTRAELLVENLANAETTRTPEGGPYRRKDAVFASEPMGANFGSLFEEHLQEGVTVQEISVDNRPPERRYLPGHPDAGPDGYVAFPRIDPAADMVDLTGAARGFQANVAAIAAVKDMLMRSIDLFK